MAAWRALGLWLLVGGALCAAGRSDSWWQRLDVRDLDGRRLAVPDRALCVVVFLEPECPVANGYVPTVNALADEFRAGGFAFFAAYCDASATREALRRHAAEYALRFAAVDDRAQRLAAHAGARYTPEAVVLARDGTVLYRGRIDDRVGHGGASRPAATWHDLRDVLRRLARGEAGPFPGERGFGCTLPQSVQP